MSNFIQGSNLLPRFKGYMNLFHLAHVRVDGGLIYREIKVSVKML